MSLFTRRLIAASLLSITLLGTMVRGQSSLKRPLDNGSVSQPSRLFIADDAALMAALAKNRFPLVLENGRLKGTGAEFLFREAEGSQFFLIAEDHGIAELPLLTSALFRQIRSYGYQHFATEAGPITARTLEKLAASQSTQQAFADFNHQNPFSLPFYFWQEEAGLLETIVHSPGRRAGPTLWGLDQEFVMSTKLHLKRLVELTPNRQARLTVEEFNQKAQTEYDRMVKSKNPGIVFLASATEDDFKRLRAALNPKPGSEAAEILDELKVSWEIYTKQFHGQVYEANDQRAQLMKRHFLRYYNEALRTEKSPPKVLFKFGMNHMKRGRSFINVFDIGSFVPDLAFTNGTKSFHLLVVGASGTQNSYLPFVGNEADKNKKYDVVEVFKDYASADVKPLIAAADENKSWAVIDLRPLRPLLTNRKLGKVDKGVEELVYGYDAVLIIPEIHAATLF